MLGIWPFEKGFHPSKLKALIDSVEIFERICYSSELNSTKARNSHTAGCIG
jgi:hypothetical protein